ncbi:MAG: putative lipid II flippase FtsW [Desulfobacterales bacterium]|nr:putative lipid II flippase FtsW [Desulfobacterales bacterium]
MAEAILEKQQKVYTVSPAYDGYLLFPVLFLVGIGVVMVYSASSAVAMKSYGTDQFFLKKQAIFSLVGIMALVICRRVPIRFLRRMAYPILALAVVGLVAVLIDGVGRTAGGATRWIRVGWFTFQPSEPARFALVIYLAYSLSKKKDRLHDFAIGMLPHVLVLGFLSFLILMQPDFGSVIILCAITWTMLFVGGVRLKHLLLPVPVLVPGLIWVMCTAEYRIKRLMSFLDPWQYTNDSGYQIVHSLMAFGTGGIWGAGVGQGYQKLFYLPEPHTDFIFSVIGEELGLVGVLAILGLYCLIVWRGVIISKNARDSFGALVAFGLSAAIGLQVAINMGVTLGMLPTKGLTLPLLSYGGTSLIMNMAAIGIIMNVGAERTV